MSIKHHFEIEDKVYLISSGIEVKIIDYVDEEYLLVEDEDADDFPVHFTDIQYFLPEKISYSQATKKDLDNPPLPIASITNITKEKEITNCFYLTFLPQYTDNFNDNILKHYSIYIHNSTPNQYRFELSQYQNNKQTFILQSEILPFQNFYSHDINIVDLKYMPKYIFKCFGKKNYNAELKLSTKVFAKKQVSLQKSPSFSFELLNFSSECKDLSSKNIDITFNHNKEALLENISIYDAITESVVDLHAENLGLSLKEFTHGEILEIQINHFEQKFFNALNHKLFKLVVIHGIGKGVLKKKIHEFLNNNPSVEKYVNEYHHQYGFGATEIYFI